MLVNLSFSLVYLVFSSCFRLQSPVQVSIVFSGGRQKPADERSKILRYVLRTNILTVITSVLLVVNMMMMMMMIVIMKLFPLSVSAAVVCFLPIWRKFGEVWELPLNSLCSSKIQKR